MLEHVHNVKDFYLQMAKITKMGGYAYHGIDLRDHLNYFRPLEFLKLSKLEYSSINTENRLRSIDHLNHFKNAGFEIISVKYGYIDKLEFKNLNSILTKTNYSYKYMDVPEILTEKDFSELNSDFRGYPSRELSITGIGILGRKYR